MHKSEALLYGFLGFLVGVAVFSVLDPQLSRIFIFILPSLGIALATVFWGRSRALAVGVFLIFLGLGIFRAQGASGLPVNSIASYNDGEKLTWRGVVVEEPDERGDKTNLTVSAETVIGEPDSPTSGRVLLTVAPYPEYAYGDELEITGKLETPFETEDFSYKNYLAKSRIFSTERYAQVDKVGEGKVSPVVAWLFKLKAYFIERLSLILPEPQNSLLAGLLVGAKRAMGEEWLEKFKTAGVSHIIAVSGFNISVITKILGDFLRRHFGPRPAFALCLLVVAAFVVLTGAQASVVRAAVMGLLTVLALNLGRGTQSLNLLLLAAVVMVAANPSILVFDVGFQLSFLATAGLILLSPVLERPLAFVPEFFELRTSLASTLSAQVFVLPLLVYYFDQLSLVSPLANLLILPVIPFAMLLGFISGLLAIVWLPAAYLSTWITWLVLTYILKIIDWSTAIPYAAVATAKIPAVWIGVYYLLLGALVFWFWARRREERIWKFLHPKIN
ncbi:MAG: ComEC family competence protein [Patescibacteria group bacterium]|nr:ComEC family competence protein [Patescibacteria group bacterium]